MIQKIIEFIQKQKSTHEDIEQKDIHSLVIDDNFISNTKYQSIESFISI